MKNITKNVFLLSGFLIFILSCGNNTERESILVGSTFKIAEKDKFQTNEDVVYQWWVGNKPDGSDYMIRYYGDKAFLTPDIEGNYDVFSSIRNGNDVELALLEFYYTAVPDTLLEIMEREVSVEPIEPKPILEPVEEESTTEIPATEPEKPIESSKTSLPHAEDGWTIQVSSRSSMEVARKDQIFLVDNGFDAYIQKVDFTDKNQTWFRVRVGNFPEKTKAQKVQREIQKIWKHDIWIDRVRAE